MWLAFAAASVGIVDYFIDLSWQLELLAFAGFLACLCLSCQALVFERQPAEQRPAQSQPAHLCFVGKSFVLSEPIVNGQGKLDIEGTRWDVLGPDLAKGATVKVTAVEGMKLRVTEA